MPFPPTCERTSVAAAVVGGSGADWDAHTEPDKLVVVRAIADGTWTDAERLLAWRREICRKHAARRTVADRRLLRAAYDAPGAAADVRVAPFPCPEFFADRRPHRPPPAAAAPLPGLLLLLLVALVLAALVLIPLRAQCPDRRG